MTKIYILSKNVVYEKEETIYSTIKHLTSSSNQSQTNKTELVEKKVKDESGKLKNEETKVEGTKMSKNDLYQKLLELISSTSIQNEKINSELDSLLSNPEIKNKLMQLHQELLKNPNQYLMQIENFLQTASLSKKKSSTTAENINKKFNTYLSKLKRFYSSHENITAENLPKTLTELGKPLPEKTRIVLRETKF